MSRIGGDEFCLLFPGSRSIDEYLRICNNLDSRINAPFYISGHKLHVSQTIGISRYPEDGDTFDQLLKIADIAMYMGKNKGQQSNNFKDRKFVQDMENRFIIQHGLDDAISKPELFVEYQPKVKLDDSLLVGAEALVRWNHPVHGLIPPNRFIYIAEETQVVHCIDFFVLETVCKQLKKWGNDAKPIAVNLSPILFADENLADEIISTLKK